jgi:hypothetical protein
VRSGLKRALAKKSAEQGVGSGAKPGDEIFPLQPEENQDNRKEKVERQKRDANHYIVGILFGPQGCLRQIDRRRNENDQHAQNRSHQNRFVNQILHVQRYSTAKSQKPEQAKPAR